MTALIALFLAAELVSGGRPRLRIETDGSPPARHAAELVRKTVVLMAGAALAETGDGPALRFERTDQPGYEIRAAKGGGVVVSGADPVRAAYDLLEGWGCRFDRATPTVPRKNTLALEPRIWRPQRVLYVEGDRLDPALPAAGLAVRGLRVPKGVRELGYELRVASPTFDDFLPPALFEKHPEWFAARDGKRRPYGNFALLNADARRAYLDAAGAWLAKHPEVDCLGLWPEVTTVWDDEALARGASEAYALLWREAAARFPKRRFEILATGLTLKPPAGRVPKNVDVRLRPGRKASGLQAIARQPIDTIVRAWEARGARVVLEIDAQPDAWCGMPWPCHEAVRDNARRFRAAVLKGGGHAHARLWRDPDARTISSKRFDDLLARARTVKSWGHPRDAADLFFDASFETAFEVAEAERALRRALDASLPDEERSRAAGAAFLGYEALHRRLPPAYRRYRARAFRQAIEKFAPEGVVHQVGTARVRQTATHVEVRTERLRLAVERSTGAVVAVHRRFRDGWSENLTGGDGRFFSVVALRVRGERTGTDVRVSAPKSGGVRVRIDGRLRAGGAAWRSTLTLLGSRIRQTARVEADGGIAAGCRWTGPVFDRWLSPPFAAEGAIAGERRTLPLPAGTLFYCRKGERGSGLAVRSVGYGLVHLTPGDATTLVATGSGRELTVDWFVFASLGELGK